MSPRAEDLTSPAGALSAALAALCQANAEAEQWRRRQYARTAADHAAEVWWHPAANSEQRAAASRYLRLSYDLDEHTKTHHAQLRAATHLKAG